MKWFKHDTDAILSEGMERLIREGGWESYGRWFRVLEIVASKMDESDRCFVEYSVKKWCDFLEISPKKFQNFVKILVDFCGISATFSDKFCRIEIPNLLKKKDEYSKKSGQTPKNIPPKSKDIRVSTKVDTKNKSKEKEFNPHTPLQGAECFSESETDVLFKWNQLANQFPKIPKVLKLSETRKTHVKQRLLESEFDLDKILSGIRGSPFLTGQTNGFKVTFDWVFSSKNNYLKVLEGNYGNANGHEPEISEARKQLLEWSKANSGVSLQAKDN